MATATATATPTPKHDVEKNLEDAVQKMRAYNERLVETGKTLTGNVIDTYEKTALGVADFQDKAAGAANANWIVEATSTQTGLTRDLTKAYVGAVRQLIK
jgi:uncharacterized hydantoinase/oxoprolinase family protein